MNMPFVLKRMKVAFSGRGAGVARTFGVGEAGGSNPLVPISDIVQRYFGLRVGLNMVLLVTNDDSR